MLFVADGVESDEADFAGRGDGGGLNQALEVLSRI